MVNPQYVFKNVAYICIDSIAASALSYGPYKYALSAPPSFTQGSPIAESNVGIFVPG